MLDEIIDGLVLIFIRLAFCHFVRMSWSGCLFLLLRRFLNNFKCLGFSLPLKNFFD